MAFDWNKPFQTRDGRPARLEHRLSKPMASGETHIVYVKGLTPGYDLYYPNGKFLASEMEDENDLVNIPEKKVVERWLVIGSHGNGEYVTKQELAQKTANDWLNSGYEARIHYIREEFSC